MTSFRSKKDGSHYPVGGNGRGGSLDTFISVKAQDVYRGVPPKVIANDLGNIDNKIWTRLGVDGGNALWAHGKQYLEAVDHEMKARFIKKGGLNRKIFLQLEDDNSHSLNHALVKLGYFDKSVMNYYNFDAAHIKELDDYYNRMSGGRYYEGLQS